MAIPDQLKSCHLSHSDHSPPFMLFSPATECITMWCSVFCVLSVSPNQNVRSTRTESLVFLCSVFGMPHAPQADSGSVRLGRCFLSPPPPASTGGGGPSTWLPPDPQSHDALLLQEGWEPGPRMGRSAELLSIRAWEGLGDGPTAGGPRCCSRSNRFEKRSGGKGILKYLWAPGKAGSQAAFSSSRMSSEARKTQKYKEY